MPRPLGHQAGVEDGLDVLRLAHVLPGPETAEKGG
jgi:hypothetical protein